MSCNSSPGIQNQAVGSSAMSTERANQVIEQFTSSSFERLCRALFSDCLVPEHVHY